jgi:hypothetical protein
MTEADWSDCADPYEMLVYVRVGQNGWRDRCAGWLCLPSHRARCRKLLLFASASCRRIFDLLADERSRQALEVCERYADGLARNKDWRQASAAAAEAAFDAESPRLAHGPWLAAAQARAAEAVAGIFDMREGPTKGALCAREAARAVGRGARGDFVMGNLPPIAVPQEIWYPWQSWSSVGTTTKTQDSEALAGEAAWKAEGEAQCHLLRDIIGNPFQPPSFQPAWRTPAIVKLAQSIYDERAFGRMPDLAAALEKAGCTDRQFVEHAQEPENHVRGCWVLDMVLGKS